MNSFERLVDPAGKTRLPNGSVVPRQHGKAPDSLRSTIAQGDFAGVGSFGQHFTGDVNPGAHKGTVSEEEFLEIVIGLPADELAAFCARFTAE